MAAYARVAVTRTALGFTRAANKVTLTAIASFPAMSAGAGGTATFLGIGTSVSGAGQLLFFGALSPTIAVTIGVTPKLDTTTSVTQAVDGMTDAAAGAFLLLLFNNVAWTGVGDIGGLLPSASAGNFFLSLHTASPGEAGNQSTSEIAYT